jgi:hypothetical protein
MIPYELLILSYGIGQDSTRLLFEYVENEEFRALYPAKRFIVVSSNTGDEHPHTYEYLCYAQEYCQKSQVEFYWLTSDQGYHSASWPGLIQTWKRLGIVGSKAFPKTCSDNLKITPTWNFVESLIAKDYLLGKPYPRGKKRGFYQFSKLYSRDNGTKPLGVMIGIAKGEESRVKDRGGEPLWMQRNVTKVFPLIDLGWDRIDCQEGIRRLGHPVPYPSNCQRCPFTNLVELLWLHRFEPSAYREWVEMERAKLSKNGHMAKKNLGVWGDNRTLDQVLDVAIDQYGHLRNEELDRLKYSGHSVRSSY